jgi:FixJ family two-component response regulator
MRYRYIRLPNNSWISNPTTTTDQAAFFSMSGYPHLAARSYKPVVQTVKAGAEDFLIKPVTSDVLIAAIERAVARHDASRKRQSDLKVPRAQVATLTPRERQVFDLMIRGKINKQIAFALGPTERTIKMHRHRVMEKMNVHSLAELILIAARLGHSAV